MSESPREFVISRTFDAPRELVWRAWTESERKTFDATHEGMQNGWTGTLDQLAAYLQEA